MTRAVRASAPARAPRATPAATVQRPDPQAWAIALSWAGGDASRLQVIDARTVVVRNQPR